MKWKDVLGYENKYQSCSSGYIRSLAKRNYKRLLSMRIKNGYFVVGLWKDNKMKTCYVHRLIGINWIPNPQQKPEINHKNGKKVDNRKVNLEWATSSENQIHAVRTGLQPKRRTPSKKK